MYNEKLVHHIKWKNGTESLVYAADANKRIPQLVIAYYEQKLLSITNPKRAVVQLPSSLIALVLFITSYYYEAVKMYIKFAKLKRF